MENVEKIEIISNNVMVLGISDLYNSNELFVVCGTADKHLAIISCQVDICHLEDFINSPFYFKRYLSEEKQEVDVLPFQEAETFLKHFHILGVREFDGSLKSLQIHLEEKK